ncbi:MAG: uracil-DNA glycosylase family protein [Bacteroidetes bacterium]|nr:MAG: uracil-DNA glycosylase family protein [Bacteroidota bacterium]
MSRSLDELLAEIRACRVCEAHLPLGPQPVLRATATARILIAGQAPGTKVHATGIPWNDLSGDRLRNWLQMDRDTFYDEGRIAIAPLGFCYPGKGTRGDLPPRPECAPLWRSRLMGELKDVRLILAVGQYAIRYHLGGMPGGSLAQTVKQWEKYIGQGVFPLPHPSPRNIGWRLQNPWFEQEVVPELSRRVWEEMG